MVRFLLATLVLFFVSLHVHAQTLTTTQFIVAVPEFAELVKIFPPLSLTELQGLLSVDKTNFGTHPLVTASNSRPVSKIKFGKILFLPRAFDNSAITKDAGEFFAIGHLPISSKAVGLVFRAFGTLDQQIKLVTFTPQGQVIGSNILRGDFQGSYGYQGSIKSLVEGNKIYRIEVMEYVTTNGSLVEKDFRNFHLLDSGEIEFSIQ